MLKRASEWAAWKFNLRKYYAFYSAYIFLDAFVGALCIALAWLYWPYMHVMIDQIVTLIFVISAHVSIKMGNHPDAVAMAQEILKEWITVDAVGNTFVTMCLMGALFRTYTSYVIYRRGVKEANEKI